MQDLQIYYDGSTVKILRTICFIHKHEKYINRVKRVCV